MIGSTYEVNNEYFNWLYDSVCKDRFAPSISFRKLLSFLHSTEFRWVIPMDSNRAADGIDLRSRFAAECRIPHACRYISGPCSVLEMMVALSIRCETFMDDPQLGDRTAQWFWGMVVSLGLGAMEDSRFNERVVDIKIQRFLHHDYKPNGEGGLFTIYRCEEDLRDMEIWHQMCRYMDATFY